MRSSTVLSQNILLPQHLQITYLTSAPAPPTATEVRRAVQATKNGKAAGIDSIHTEMLKADLNTSVKILTGLLKNIWDKSVIPEDWARGLTAKIPKKGNLQNCNNWRGINLLSIPSKVFSRITLGRTANDTKLRQEQASTAYTVTPCGKS